MIEIEDFDFDNILLDEKSNESILVYDFSYKNLIGAKPLRIRFDRVDGFIRVYDGTRYLVLFGHEKYNAISNKIKYFISLKSGIIHVISHNYARPKVDSYDSFSMMLNDYKYSLSRFLIKIKLTTTIIYFMKKLCINRLKIMIINKFLYKS